MMGLAVLDPSYALGLHLRLQSSNLCNGLFQEIEAFWKAQTLRCCLTNFNHNISRLSDTVDS